MCGAQEEVGELVLFRASQWGAQSELGLFPVITAPCVCICIYTVCVCANCKCTHQVAAICVVKGTCICWKRARYSIWWYKMKSKHKININLCHQKIHARILINLRIRTGLCLRHLAHWQPYHSHIPFAPTSHSLDDHHLLIFHHMNPSCAAAACCLAWERENRRNNSLTLSAANIWMWLVCWYWKWSVLKNGKSFGCKIRSNGRIGKQEGDRHLDSCTC